jgi:hypothetical protein
MSHTGGELCRHVDGKSVISPVSDERVRFEAAMCLHVSPILPLDNDISLCEPLRDVTTAVARRSSHIAIELQPVGGGKA